MQALLYEGPWRMPLAELARPAPGPDEVVVRVEAVGVCGSDVHGYTGSTGRRTSGVVMGHEFAGTVEALGERVTARRVGERVIVQPFITCGACEPCRAGRPNICAERRLIGMHVHGAYAEAVRVPERQLFALPEGLPWEHAALAEPLAVALHAVNATPLALMESVVIVGAGPIGLLALLAARLKGAGTVVVTDRSAHRLALARRLGADVVVNVAEEDPVAAVLGVTDGLGAHAAIEAVGLSATAQQAQSLVRTGGHVTWIGNSAPEVTINMQQVVTRELTVRGVYGFSAEFAQAVHALGERRIDVGPLVELVAPLAEGPRLFEAMAQGKLEAAKVILKP